ncbi:MAG TPA: LysM peptidoglycan-binding domain-containing protein [Intrasporangium sp.]|uniref:LysM peptidoglycan-binding domain-containing protein n=1 Tax=Intrasporangium sp. TaxID=1925024 RepID=UPI002D799DF2|nr:LysM peptidoglycan-binding domain-containing protein [Intrasporangium sp.]HET7397991.1 LysM peptidoglycan-binding domain-containing protein [Intrasporangium sp.]
MSAVLSALPLEPGRGPRPRPAAPARPRLVLVPTGASAVRAAREARPALRPTRFARLLLALLVAAALGLLAVTVAGSFASASGHSRAVTVEAGDTLSQIAARELPELPVADGVVQLRLLNELPTSEVHAGQTLRIPRS